MTTQDHEALAQWQGFKKVESGFRSPLKEGASMANQDALLMAGIRNDGTVIALGAELNREVSAWTKMKDIESGDGFLAGLKEDGTVVIAGKNRQLLEKEKATWTGIEDIACGLTFCVGVTEDGRVLFAGDVRFTPG
jgi:alpha-tubulin suppressor-like RCC1 family protein